MPHTGLREYSIVTAAYWGFTLTDGALRMLVLLHFHKLGYSPLELASLFLLYEICGIVTNLVGGWMGNRLGLSLTLNLGLAMQIVALLLLSLLQESWPREMAVIYVLLCQGLSGVAKDFTKMSAKSALKLIVPTDPGRKTSPLFKWVAVLTGSKNTLKGVGFFLGGLLLSGLGFGAALWMMALGLTIVLLSNLIALPRALGKPRRKTPFRTLLSKSPAINMLSLARLFLFGARDAWFVVGLPLFLYEGVGLDFAGVGGLMALWVIGYGVVQALTPKALRIGPGGLTTELRASCRWLSLLAALPLAMLSLSYSPLDYTLVVLGGLALFGVVFAVNSALHSYLILALTSRDHVALDVGFYYMANAAGRLLGTIVSGFSYQWGGLNACLAASAAMLALAMLSSFCLPRLAASRAIAP